MTAGANAAAGRGIAPRLVAIGERVEEAFLFGTITATFAALVLQVGSRYLFDLPLAWTEEAARYLFIWSVYFGASQALRHREHIAIGFFVERLPAAVRLPIALTMNLMTGAFLLLVVVKGQEIAQKVAELPATATEVSMAWVYLPLPVAGSVMLVRVVADSLRLVRHGPIDVEHRSL